MPFRSSSGAPRPRPGPRLRGSNTELCLFSHPGTLPRRAPSWNGGRRPRPPRAATAPGWAGAELHLPEGAACTSGHLPGRPAPARGETERLGAVLLLRSMEWRRKAVPPRAGTASARRALNYISQRATRGLPAHLSSPVGFI